MVANYLTFSGDNKKQSNSSDEKYSPTRCVIYGILFLYFLLLLFTSCLKTRIIKNDTVNTDLRYKNYEDIYKIYNETLTKNSTWNLPRGKVKGVKLNSFRIVCYYIISSNLTRSRQLPPNSVDPYLCTHIILGFATIKNATIQPQTPTDKEVYKSIVNLKSINPSLKILLSVQDFSSSGEFALVVSSDAFRTSFAKNTLTFLNNTGFDGIDLDWEFPSWPDADLVQAKNFSLLLAEFRQLMNNTGYNIYKNFILSVAVGAPDLIVRQSYEIQDMAKLIDFVNLMSYDYHMYSQYLPLTGPNSPLYCRNADTGYMLTLNTNWSANNWASMGMPLSKINVGIPTYGHSFRLVNENNNGWNAPAAGFGRTGSGDGFFSYPEACKFIADVGTTHVFDDEYEVPYAYNRDEWISYDNSNSVSLKASYVKNNNFGGAMIYSLNCDDFEGVCSTQKFPLTRTISNILTVN